MVSRASAAASPRLHDLDALRAFAMLLGVGVHAALPAIVWRHEADGTFEGRLIDWFAMSIHGFRMPVFFLMSGFFAAMLWQRRGLRGLVRHRVHRVAVPLAIAVVTIVPLTLGAFTLAAGISGQGRRAIGEEPLAGFQFFHLWFLWFLLLLLAGFCLCVVAGRALARALGRSELLGPRALAAVLLILPAATLVPELMMAGRIFGPDTSEGLAPGMPVLAYYATFFAFGAVAHAQSGLPGATPVLTRLGRGWWFLLPIAALVLLPAGVLLTFHAGPGWWPLAALVQVLYTWTCCVGLVGLFQRVLGRERPWVRYLADASYWIYLVHFPLIVVAQGFVLRWARGPESLWFLVMTTAVFAVALVSYHWWVRYGAIGRLLNGARARPAVRSGIPPAPPVGGPAAPDPVEARAPVAQAAG